MSSTRIEREEKRAGASNAPGVYNFLYVVFIYVNEFFVCARGSYSYCLCGADKQLILSFHKQNNRDVIVERLQESTYQSKIQSINHYLLEGGIMLQAESPSPSESNSNTYSKHVQQ